MSLLLRQKGRERPGSFSSTISAARNKILFIIAPLTKDDNGGRASLLAFWAFRYSHTVDRAKPDARYKLVRLLIKEGASLNETMFIEGETRDIADLIDFYASDGSSKVVIRQARELVGLPEN